MKRKYNRKPDRKDERDFKYSDHLQIVNPESLPQSENLIAKCPPVFDQGDIGSCTGNALAGMLGWDELQQMRLKTASSPEVFDPSQYEPFSRLMIYYNERRIEGTTDQDAGAELRDGIKALVQWGACRESVWPYSDSNALVQPSTAAYTEAASHKISKYLRISTLTEMRHCLASGSPFVFGFTVYDYFESEEMAKTGILKMPKPNDQPIGGHAVMCVGYDPEYFWVRNSWGADWGPFGGYFKMPKAYITDPNLAEDAWAILR